MTNTERVFVFGSTGNVGIPLVKDLLANQVPTTIYVRNVEKAKSLFQHDHDQLTIIEGDNEDTEKLKQAIQNHTRLFLMINYPDQFIKKLHFIIQLAFESGIQQIVHISSVFASYPHRIVNFGYLQLSGEETLFSLVKEFNEKKDADEKKKRYAVVLRPSRFTSNLLYTDRPIIQQDHGILMDIVDLNQPQEWISVNDVAKVTSNIFQDPIDKHGFEAVYELKGDLKTPKERLTIFENVFNRPFTYQQVSVPDRIKKFLQFPQFSFKEAYDIGSFKEPNPDLTPGMELLLGRKPQTLEEYLFTVKDSLL